MSLDGAIPMQMNNGECPQFESTPLTDHLVGGLAYFPVAILFAEVQVR
jgi:hypothetical protein